MTSPRNRVLEQERRRWITNSQLRRHLATRHQIIEPSGDMAENIGLHVYLHHIEKDNVNHTHKETSD